MIKIQEISDLFPASVLAQLSPPDLTQVLRNIGEAARNHWIGLASEINSHLRFDYVEGIMPLVVQTNQVALVLVGDAAHYLEEGVEPYDMRKTLLGPNVPEAPFGQPGKRRAKAGHFYRAIPFRHTTPGTEKNPRGKTIGQEMGSAYKGHQAVKDSKALGRDIYDQAIQLEAGERLPAGLAPIMPPKRMPTGINIHKTDIYAGMIRQKKTYERATQATYFTFRTISEAVKTGWHHPGIPKQALMPRVGEFAARLAPQAFQAYVKGRAGK